MEASSCIKTVLGMIFYDDDKLLMKISWQNNIDLFHERFARGERAVWDLPSARGVAPHSLLPFLRRQKDKRMVDNNITGSFIYHNQPIK